MIELRTQIPLGKLRVMVVQVPAEIPSGELAAHRGGTVGSLGIYGGQTAQRLPRLACADMPQRKAGERADDPSRSGRSWCSG